MLKNETKKVLTIVFVFAIVLFVFMNSTYAIDFMKPTNNTVNQTTDPNNIPSIGGIGIQPGNYVNNTANTANTTNHNIPVVTGNTLNNNKLSTYTNSDLPKTGVEDYPIVILMAICVIVAVYAYIKVKNYNNL